jgi:hypothetical protein
VGVRVPPSALGNKYREIEAPQSFEPIAVLFFSG